MKFQFVLTLFICLAMQVLEAAAISVTDYYSITTSEGLPSNTIGAIKKDSSGFIWLGTGAGLCRFDGCEIKTYPVLAGDDIWSIEELDTDTLLIGTVSGFKYFSRKTNEVFVLDIPSTIVKAIKKIDDRRFLAGTEAGLFLVDKHTPRQILLDSGLSPCNHITSIIREDKDVYWFSTADGLGRIDVRTMKPVIYRMKDALSNTNFFICLTRIGNQIYLGSFNKGVFRFDMSDKKFTKVDGFEHNLIMTIEAQGNQLFVGTNGQGLKIMSLTDGSIEIASHKEKIRNTISSNTITSFLYDNGIQWVGTQFGGVSYTPSTKARFFCYSKNDFYTADYKVRSFYMFPDGNKLIGTRAGLFHVSEKDGTVRKYSLENHSSKLRSNIILFINKVDDKILIGTYGGGMHVFDEKTLQLGDLSEEEPFLYGCFFHFTQDKAGHLWIASQEGLYQSTADGHILKKYDTMNSLLTTNAVFYVYADSMDRLWIGTKFGLFLMDIKSGKLRTDCFGTPITDEVKCIIEDSHKDIWVCSRSGLYRIGEDLQVADHFTKENLLPDDQVMSILEDRQGNYWIATCEEVVKYTPSENKHCTYQMQNEIDDLDFNNAVVMFADSTVWWTNEGGLIYTSEKNISVTKKLAANPTITSCYVGDVEYDFPYMDQSRGIVLPESGNSIRFKFSNLDYSLPNANVYEYRLEGYDKDWIKQNGVNEVTYKDLPSGKYVFKLRVPDGDVMTEQQTVVVVRKSYSFLIGLFLVAVLIAILIVYFSSKIWKLKRRMTNERIILSTVKEQGKAKKTVLPEVKVNSLLDNLLSYMENEKPYLSAKLNISDVSMKLDCTEIELSQLLNNHLNVNFSNFINTYRVNEIKHRLNQDNLSKYTLKALSEQCGFSSKTTFYRVFKNVTGMTPLEYYKRENLVIAEI
ncbi:MAG: two-component regulator propeller domain-containing protein [Bacteroides uniformis]